MTSDPTKAYIRLISPTQMEVHPPQGLTPGVYSLRLSSGQATSKAVNVTLALTTAPTLLMPQAVTVGQNYSAIVAKGGVAAPHLWLAYSLSAVPSVLPGVFDFGIGDGFRQLYFWPLVGKLSPVTGATRFVLPTIQGMKGLRAYFQGLYATQGTPLPVTNVQSVLFR